MVEVFVFYLVGAAVLITSVLAISRRQPIFGILYLFLTGLLVSVLFAMKKAFFLALLQIVIYVGAVLVLFVFVVAMMNLKPHEMLFGALGRWRYSVFALIIPIFAILGSVVYSEIVTREQKHLYFTAKEVGGYLYRNLLFHFEYLSILLVVAIVVAVFVGSRFERR